MSYSSSSAEETPLWDRGPPVVNSAIVDPFINTNEQQSNKEERSSAESEYDAENDSKIGMEIFGNEEEADKTSDHNVEEEEEKESGGIISSNKSGMAASTNNEAVDDINDAASLLQQKDEDNDTKEATSIDVEDDAAAATTQQNNESRSPKNVIKLPRGLQPGVSSGNNPSQPPAPAAELLPGDDGDVVNNAKEEKRRLKKEKKRLRKEKRRRKEEKRKRNEEKDLSDRLDVDKTSSVPTTQRSVDNMEEAVNDRDKEVAKQSGLIDGALSGKKRKESAGASATANTTTEKASAATAATSSTKKKKEKNKDKATATTSSKKQKTAKDNTNNEEEMGMVNLKSREVLSDQLEKQTHARLAANRNDGSVHQPTALFILARDKKNKNVRFRKKMPGCARVKDNKQLDIDMTNLSNKEDKKIGQHARRLHEDFNFQKKESKEKISRRPGPKTPEWTDYYHVDFTTLENARKISRSDNYKKAARQRQHKNRHEKIGNTNEESKMNDDGEAIPKPPASAYIDYSSSIRPKIKEENPNATPTEMMTLIGAAYKALDEETLQKFKDKATKNMAEYKAKYGEDALTKYKRQAKKDKEKKKKDRGKKKRKSSAAIGAGDEGGAESPKKKKQKSSDTGAAAAASPKKSVTYDQPAVPAEGLPAGWTTRGDEADGVVEKKRKYAIDVAAKGDELPKERRKEKNKKSKKKK